jgi:hypothetical protein
MMRDRRRTGHHGRIVLVTLALLLVCLRLAMPFALKAYVQQRLNSLPEHSGRVGAIQINLFRGAYQIVDLHIFKTISEVPVPLLSVEKMDLSIEWEQLIRGAIVGEVAMSRPVVNIVTGPTEEQTQTGADDGWKKTLESLFPFTINRFEINDGLIRYADPHRDPPVDVYMTNFFAVATNLTNVEDKKGELHSGLVARGITTGGGRLRFQLLMNPLAKLPTFQLAASLTGVDLTALNDFLQSFAKVDAHSGRFWFFLRVGASDGRYRGFAKPFFLDVDMLEWEDVEDGNLLETFWEALVAGVMKLFTNQSKDQIATRIPIQGEVEDGARIDLASTIAGIIRNAFIQALEPGLADRVSGSPAPAQAGTEETGQ